MTSLSIRKTISDTCWSSFNAKVPSCCFKACLYKSLPGLVTTRGTLVVYVIVTENGRLDLGRCQNSCFTRLTGQHWPQALFSILFCQHMMRAGFTWAISATREMGCTSSARKAFKLHSWKWTSAFMETVHVRLAVDTSIVSYNKAFHLIHWFFYCNWLVKL